jgi:hypothetical protein
MPRHAFELEGVDEAFGRTDLAKLAVERVFVAILVVLDKASGATRPSVQRLDRRRQPARTPPVRNVVAVGMRLEDQLTGRVGDPRGADDGGRGQQHDRSLWSRRCHADRVLLASPSRRSTDRSGVHMHSHRFDTLTRSLVPSRSRRHVIGNVVVALACWTKPLVVAGRRKRKKKRRKKKSGPGRITVTKTFTNQAPITIPAGAPNDTFGKASPYPSVINVAGFANGRITRVTVTLHGFSFAGAPNDVDILLVATHLPGNDALIMSDVGGTTPVQSLTLTLDDQAAATLPTPLVSSGTFKPTNNGASDSFPAPAPTPTGNVALSVFNNGNPNGTWQLWVFDDLATDVGSIAGGWSLQISAEVVA